MECDLLSLLVPTGQSLKLRTTWEMIKDKVGKDEMQNIPFGAVAMYGYVDKLRCGLQQFLAGARKFNLSEISRNDLMSANRETEKETALI